LSIFNLQGPLDQSSRVLWTRVLWTRVLQDQGPPGPGSSGPEQQGPLDQGPLDQGPPGPGSSRTRVLQDQGPLDQSSRVLWTRAAGLLLGFRFPAAAPICGQKLRKLRKLRKLQKLRKSHAKRKRLRVKNSDKKVTKNACNLM
jgi:hypothetical protein